MTQPSKAALEAVAGIMHACCLSQSSRNDITLNDAEIAAIIDRALEEERKAGDRLADAANRLACMAIQEEGKCYPALDSAIVAYRAARGER